MNVELPYHDKPSAWSSHSLIAREIDKLATGSKVLDVGVATGMLVRMCRNKSLRFFGIEPNANWARMATPLYEKIQIGSVNEVADEFLSAYDMVVLGDVLEHLSDPQAVLQRLVSAQSSRSLFLISVPNVANLWVRLNLLLGRFDYTDRGILDRTHLRFFTRKTLLSMLKHTGLEIMSIRVTPIPLELVSGFFLSAPGRLLHSTLASITRLLPTLLGYQFIVKARKP